MYSFLWLGALEQSGRIACKATELGICPTENRHRLRDTNEYLFRGNLRICFRERPLEPMYVFGEPRLCRFDVSTTRRQGLQSSPPCFEALAGEALDEPTPPRSLDKSGVCRHYIFSPNADALWPPRGLFVLRLELHHLLLAKASRHPQASGSSSDVSMVSENVKTFLLNNLNFSRRIRSNSGGCVAPVNSRPTQ